jgi:hypothetical protein
MSCVCVFSLRRESPGMILGDKPLIYVVVLSHTTMFKPFKSAIRHLICQSNHKTQVIWKGREGLLCYSLTFPLLRVSHGCWRCLFPLRCGHAYGPIGC